MRIAEKGKKPKLTTDPPTKWRRWRAIGGWLWREVHDHGRQRGENKASDGSSIPTLYGGTTFDCAAMETIFHDVPFAPGLKTFDKQKLADQVYSQVTPKRTLSLADLSTKALRKLGVQRNELIDTEKDVYPSTRKWAEAIHAGALARRGSGCRGRTIAPGLSCSSEIASPQRISRQLATHVMCWQMSPSTRAFWP
jgi:hypothetical protein